MSLGRLLKYLPPVFSDMVWSWRRDDPHEEDFYLYSHLDGIPGLFVDVGANWGQSAESFFTTNRSLRMLSLEPNTELRWLLMMTFLRHPLRFRFRMAGAGERRQRLLLHIPQTRYKNLSAMATFEPREFEKGYVMELLQQYAAGDHGQYAFSTRRARILALDSLRLNPLVVKLDVEGWELQALKGMENTLKRYHPLLMIELNNRQEIFPWLIERGYRFFHYRHDPDSLIPIGENDPCLNAFCLHSRTPASIRDRLTPLMPERWSANTGSAF